MSVKGYQIVRVTPRIHAVTRESSVVFFDRNEATNIMKQFHKCADGPDHPNHWYNVVVGVMVPEVVVK